MYLHLLRNPYGKIGFPAKRQLSVRPVLADVSRVVWMNEDREVNFRQEDERLSVDLEQVTEDPVDTILRIELASPYPDSVGPLETPAPRPPGNLASHRPAKLLSADGVRALIPSMFAFARYGVDDSTGTVAQAGGEWAWAYEVDLEKVYPVRRVVIRFGNGYATEYRVLLSEDGQEWSEMVHVIDSGGGIAEHVTPPSRTRYVRIQAVKPDGPDQEGVQMSIAGLEVYSEE